MDPNLTPYTLCMIRNPRQRPGACVSADSARWRPFVGCATLSTLNSGAMGPPPPRVLRKFRQVFSAPVTETVPVMGSRRPNIYSILVLKGQKYRYEVCLRRMIVQCYPRNFLGQSSATNITCPVVGPKGLCTICQNHVTHVTKIFSKDRNVTFPSIQSRGYSRSRGKRPTARAMEVETVLRDSGHMAVLKP